MRRGLLVEEHQVLDQIRALDDINIADNSE